MCGWQLSVGLQRGETMSDLPLEELAYFANLDEEGNKVRPVFIPNACQVCKKLHGADNVKLLSCSGCRMIAYCGAPHQKDHWKEHKDLCKIVKDILRAEAKTSLFDGLHKLRLDADQWKALRYDYMVRTESRLQRPMLPYEREMFLYPRACSTCFNDNGANLEQCDKCRSVFSCCSEHLPPNHQKWCTDLRLLLDINILQSQKGKIGYQLPSKMLTEYEDLPASMKEFLVTRMMGPMAAMMAGKESFAMISEMASYPLTVLWALQSIVSGKIKKLSERKSLVLHVVGAEMAFEGDNLAKWDVFILNVLPEVKSLYIVFVGPELEVGVGGELPRGAYDEDLRCPHCIRSNKQFVCDFQPGVQYHDYVKGSSYIRPDAIIAFNCGLYRSTGFQNGDSWGQSIPYLLQEDVPLILTAYTAAEAPQDLLRLQQTPGSKVEVLLEPSENPYRSLRPCRNFVSEEETPLIYKNKYITVVTKGKQ